ncbi:MAG: EamA family transporter [Thermoanaerobaculia bacterium]|nr:EamA family transporter [Thermoanaerobaculia bacterium]
MTSRPPGHGAAVATAAFVTFLWSTSWVLIKVGLAADLPPLPFAGLRYAVAALCLLPFALATAERRNFLATLDRRSWRSLSALGLLYIAVAQGGQFAALALLPASAVSLLLSLTPVVVAFGSGALLGEKPTPLQAAGTFVAVSGAALYFFPTGAALPSAAGLAAGLVALLSNAGSALLGRRVNRDTHLPPLLVTFVSMSIGAAALLGAGVAAQGWPALGPRELAIVAWLAVVNTAFAFTLWNRSLRVLTAVESSVLNGLMLPQIALLAVLFLGESLSGRQVVALVLAAAGALAVQIRRPG